MGGLGAKDDIDAVPQSVSRIQSTPTTQQSYARSRRAILALATGGRNFHAEQAGTSIYGQGSTYGVICTKTRATTAPAGISGWIGYLLAARDRATTTPSSEGLRVTFALTCVRNGAMIIKAENRPFAMDYGVCVFGSGAFGYAPASGRGP
jgi:hypothetical protein